MKTKLRVIVIAGLMLLSSSTRAGIISIPGTLEYNPVPIPTRDVTVPMLVVSTTGIEGVFKPDCGESAQCQAAIGDCTEIPFTQQLELRINLRTGNVEGRTRGELVSVNSLDYLARVRGDATCLPRAGRACAQLLVELEAQGPFVDSTNPGRVGQVRMQMLGNLLRDAESLRWAALSANATLALALPDDVAEQTVCP